MQRCSRMPRPGLRSLTEYKSDGPFFDEAGVLSVTFFIEEGA